MFYVATDSAALTNRLARALWSTGWSVLWSMPTGTSVLVWRRC